ncbi:MAG TPA: pilus assembly protein PilM [Pirellulales bacterium]|jgi:type IV pilus assembly protein PilM
MLTKRATGPIGVDIGSRSVKLLQFNADRTRVVDAARRELPPLGVRHVDQMDETRRMEKVAGGKAFQSENARSAEAKSARQAENQTVGQTAAVQDNAEMAKWYTALTEAIRAIREGGNFRGREAVVCLGARELLVQNLRLPKAATPGEMEGLVHQEAAGRMPFPHDEAEIRFLEAADVRQGDSVKREVILLACHRPPLERMLAAIEAGGLKTTAVDVEPLALLRCYGWQFRRDEDRHQRAMFIHMGAESAAVVIAHGREPLFIKYIDVGGRHMDEAVAAHLKMELPAATALRRHNGDRRSDQQDPEIAKSVAEASRSVLERLTTELAMCVRYHSVTFRGQPLARMVIGGGEASTALAEELSTRLDLKCELGDPLRNFELAIQTGRRGQWDLAVGMALRTRTTAVA